MMNCSLTKVLKETQKILGYRVVWHGLEDEKAAKAFYQTLLEFRVEKTCKALRDLGIQR